jgi:hypothetical protein
MAAKLCHLKQPPAVFAYRFKSVPLYEKTTAKSDGIFMAGETGLEPAAPGFGDQCSTN